jgi:hypothetical protein
MKNLQNFEEFLNESLNEARAPKSWNTMFAMNVINAFKNKEFDVDNKNSIAKWDTDYNAGNPPRPPFETEAIVRHYLATGKGPDGKP